jgi:peptidyl-prolyl cis-trans isomerase B (cyclophilin B)
MKKWIALLLALVLVLGLAACKRKEAPKEPLDMEQVKAEINSMQIEDFEPSNAPTDYVKITVKDFGEIVVKLRPDAAPISAQNFKNLVARHYYNGTVFHRVYPGFMIQGGAGTENLTPIKGEFSANGVENPLLHLRGVLSMARTKVMDSATSQFFLMHADYPSLNGNYAAFGYIVAGLETVDKVCEIPLGSNGSEQSVPQVDVIMESAVFVTPG